MVSQAQSGPDRCYSATLLLMILDSVIYIPKVSTSQAHDIDDSTQSRHPHHFLLQPWSSIHTLLYSNTLDFSLARHVHDTSCVNN